MELFYYKYVYMIAGFMVLFIIGFITLLCCEVYKYRKALRRPFSADKVIIYSLWGQPDLDFTPRKVKALCQCWSLVTRNVDSFRTVGIEIFLKLFRRHPKYKELFDKFRYMDHGQLHDSTKMAAHALTFMHSMNSIVSTVKDLDVVDEIMASVAENHIKRGVLPEHFQTFFTVFMSVIRDKAGPAYDADMEEAWRTFVLRLMKTVERFYNRPISSYTVVKGNGSAP